MEAKMTDATNPTPSQAEPRDSGKTLTRGLLMLLFLVLTSLARYVTIVIALVQFGWMLATGAPNVWLKGFGASLAVWIADTTRFLSAVSDDKPFPWKPWPEVKPGA
jgi:hypothetical protein